MVDVTERTSLEFQEVAAPTSPRRAVTVNIDADVLEYLEAEGPKVEFSSPWEPGEMEEPPPAP